MLVQQYCMHGITVEIIKIKAKKKEKGIMTKDYLLNFKI